MSPARTTLWAAAFWLLLLGGLLALAGERAWRVHHTAAEQLASIEPRVARLAGLGEHRARLQEAAQRAAGAVARHAYPSSRDASQAGNDAQQRVRDLFAKSGLDVVSLQVLASRPSGQFDRIPIAARVEGPLEMLQAALAAAPALAPTVFVEGFSLQSASVTESAPPRVVAELQLFVLRGRN